MLMQGVLGFRNVSIKLSPGRVSCPFYTTGGHQRVPDRPCIANGMLWGPQTGFSQRGEESPKLSGHILWPSLSGTKRTYSRGNGQETRVVLKPETE